MDIYMYKNMDRKKIYINFSTVVTSSLGRSTKEVSILFYFLIKNISSKYHKMLAFLIPESKYIGVYYFSVSLKYFIIKIIKKNTCLALGILTFLE